MLDSTPSSFAMDVTALAYKENEAKRGDLFSVYTNQPRGFSESMTMVY